jgi:hypothetical protein
MWCRLTFVDPLLCELDPFESGIVRGLEGAPKATQSPYPPDTIILPAHHNAKFPPSAAASGQVNDMNVMSLVFEFHRRLAVHAGL